ncbi:universal stress protein [Xanthocytophaga flava]|uniref:universal stress protein n=1 Tax=Xanthocytophaga flava TaxID=3048013 RepID=UPI0028D12961|nr:universal stress protein [Xanthocytophaga flavus]MDJ1466210.1 universal stress protein [Xanthocytophaga flavus]
MQTILCPIDFSQNSHAELKYASQFAKFIGARLLLVYIEPIPYLDPDTFIAEPVIADLEEARQQLAALCKEFSTEVPCDYLVQSGAASDMIIAITKEKNIDWIVMGTKGADNKPEALVGSVTADVAQETSCPLIIVPQKVSWKPIHTIVLASDFKETKHQLLNPLITIAQQANAQVFALHIESEATELSEEKAIEAIRLEDWLGAVSSSMHTLVHEDVQEGIDAFVHKQHADLVAVIARKHGFFASLFHRSVTRQLALYTDVPTLVIPE